MRLQLTDILKQLRQDRLGVPRGTGSNLRTPGLRHRGGPRSLKVLVRTLESMTPKSQTGGMPQLFVFCPGNKPPLGIS